MPPFREVRVHVVRIPWIEKFGGFRVPRGISSPKNKNRHGSGPRISIFFLYEWGVKCSVSLAEGMGERELSGLLWSLMVAKLCTVSSHEIRSSESRRKESRTTEARLVSTSECPLKVESCRIGILFSRFAGNCLPERGDIRILRDPEGWLRARVRNAWKDIQDLLR